MVNIHILLAVILRSHDFHIITYKTIIHFSPQQKSEDFFFCPVSVFSTCTPTCTLKKDIQSPSHRLVGYVGYILQQPTRGKPNKKYHPTVSWIGWVGLVGLGWVVTTWSEHEKNQVFGTFDHVALPLDFCFPGFVEPTEGPRKFWTKEDPWDLCCSFLASCFAVFGWGALAGSFENYTRTCQDSIYHL